MVNKPNGTHYKQYSNNLVQLFKTKRQTRTRIRRINKHKIGIIVT